MATHIKNIIQQFLENKKAGAVDVSGIKEVVEEHLGGKLKKHISLENIDKKNLIFCSDSSSALYEFKLKKEKLLEAVKSKFPYIEGIKIKIN